MLRIIGRVAGPTGEGEHMKASSNDDTHSGAGRTRSTAGWLSLAAGAGLLTLVGTGVVGAEAGGSLIEAAAADQEQPTPITDLTPDQREQVVASAEQALAERAPGSTFEVVGVAPGFDDAGAIEGAVVDVMLDKPLTGVLNLPGFRFGTDPDGTRVAVNSEIAYDVKDLQGLTVSVLLDTGVNYIVPRLGGTDGSETVLSTSLISETRADGRDLPVPPAEEGE